MTAILGTTLPVQKSAGGWFALQDERTIIRGSIRMILGTFPGERVLVPDYGSRIRALVHEPSDEVFAALASQYVIEAIRRWERRVTLIRNGTKVLLPSSGAPGLTPNQAKITIRYIINSKSVEDNLDFIVNRGT